MLSIAVRGDDLSFLRALPELRGLVLNAGEVRDLSAVEALGALETLTLNTPAKPRLALDFGAFARAADAADVLERGLRVGVRVRVAGVAVRLRAAGRRTWRASAR